MSLNSTPVAERTHIGFFGRRNAGKSSVVNAVTNQQVSVVSDYAGTTTDPVTKTMELLPLGPVVIIDTPGFDDEGSLGELRVKRTRQTLNRVDIAVLVVDGTCGKTAADDELISIYNEKGIPYIVVYNKCDLFDAKKYSDGVCVSATTCYISRRHCTIEPDGNHFLIRDGQKSGYSWKRSTNGTYVNSTEVTERGFYLAPDDIITIGDVKMRFEPYYIKRYFT